MILTRPQKTGTKRLDEFLEAVYVLTASGFIRKQVRVAASYTALKSDFYIGVTSTAAPRTITLPALASLPDEIVYIVKDESGGAAANNITIDASGAEQIDGALTKVINTNYGVVRLLRSPTAWFSW